MKDRDFSVLRAIFPGEATFVAKLDVMKTYLLAEEVERVDRMSRDRGWFFICGRFLARWYLNKKTGTPIKDLPFVIGEKGKPELGGPLGRQGYHVNISHTTERILIAVSTGGPVGVDIEQIREVKALEIAERMFHPDDIAKLRSLKDEALLLEFFRIATFKEAYIKARGLSLFSEATSQISMANLKDGICLVDDGKWVVSAVPTNYGFASAIAFQAPYKVPTQEDFDWSVI